MRVILVPTAFAVALALSPAAFAATQTTTGAIKAMNMKAHTLTLANGTVYSLPTGFHDRSLKTGEKVSIEWSMRNGKHQASSVKAAD
jgi:hypothetical protein